MSVTNSSQADTYCLHSTQPSSPPKRVLSTFESISPLNDAITFDHQLTQQPAKLFVGSIAGSSTKEDLTRMFSVFGPIVEVVILVEKDGRPKFSAFINMKRRCDAQKAIDTLDRSYTVPGAKKILEVRFAENPNLKVPGASPVVNKTERSYSNSASSTDADSSVASPTSSGMDCISQSIFSVKVGDSAAISQSSSSCGYDIFVPDAFSAVLTWLELTELGLQAQLA